MIEAFLRLGVALLLSLSLAVLMAWGWSHSDRSADPLHSASFNAQGATLSAAPDN